jgi:hypothetical protein
MGQEAGEKGAVAASLQPTIPKSDRLLGRPLLNFAQLLPPGSAAEHSDWCAPAVAVGWLLAERVTRKGS